jgi:NADH dehydrogenase FAD-containing subunit
MTAVNRSATPAVACAVAADRPIWTGVAATSLPRVVIVGAGFAGLSAAKALRRAPVEVTVIDKRNYHLFQPLLYQVATAALSPADIASPIRGILRGQRNASVVLGKITGIDKVDRSVLVGDRRISYDYLVVATGARHAYFGHDEWEPFAPGLKKIDDATDIRRKVLVAFEHAENAEDESERRRLMTFVVIGAGPTGVEMAGAIAELAKMALAKQFRRIDPTMSRIILVEAGSRVLSTFPESLSDVAKRSLEELGVELRLSSRVTQCDPDGAVIAGERVASRTIIWAAGVAASPAAKWLGADKDPAGRVIVGAGVSRDFHHRRHRPFEKRGRKAITWHSTRRQAAGDLCRPSHPRTGGGPRSAHSVPLPPLRQHGDNRAEVGGRGFRLRPAFRSRGLVRVGSRAHLLPDRLPKPPRRRARLVLGVSDVPARGPPDHRR